jgi:hypothetical protein
LELFYSKNAYLSKSLAFKKIWLTKFS